MSLTLADKIKWKDTPFFKVLEPLTSTVEFPSKIEYSPEAQPPTDTRQGLKVIDSR